MILLWVRDVFFFYRLVFFIFFVTTTAGCQASGKFRVGLIPGSLIFTAYSPWHSFDKESVDMTHRVDKFMFGPQTSIFSKSLEAEWEVTKALEEEGYHMNSMAGHLYERESEEKKTHEHYLRLMQTDIDTKLVQKLSRNQRRVYNTFKGMIFKTFQTFQYAVNTHTIEEDEQELPAYVSFGTWIRSVWRSSSRIRVHTSSLHHCLPFQVVCLPCLVLRTACIRLPNDSARRRRNEKF